MWFNRAASRRPVFALITLLLASCGIMLAQAGQKNPVPFLSQPLEPATATPGGTHFTLTLHGTGFVRGSVVQWNGSGRPTTFVSSHQLRAKIGDEDILTAGTATVTVLNQQPGGGVSNLQYFQITTPGVITVSNATNYSSGNTYVAAADLNGDGKLDMVVSNAAGSVAVLLGNGDGTFQPAVQYGAGSEPEAVVVADFNNDGKMDLAVSNHTGSSISILLGNGDGTFQPHVDYMVGTYPTALVMGDFNRDGNVIWRW